MLASLRDWLPEDISRRSGLTPWGELELGGFCARYRDDGRGGHAYEPSMMVALMLHTYCDGERSSRQIERRCREDIAFRVLTANQRPDHATICRFRCWNSTSAILVAQIHSSSDAWRAIVPPPISRSSFAVTSGRVGQPVGWCGQGAVTALS